MVGLLVAKLYVDRVDLSKRAVGKCVQCSGKWYSPSEFETLGGKRAKKWRQSLFHLGKRLCEYNLSTQVANSVPILSCGEASHQHVTPDVSYICRLCRC